MPNNNYDNKLITLRVISAHGYFNERFDSERFE